MISAKKSLAHCNITETYLITYFMHKKVLGRIYLWVWYPKNCVYVPRCIVFSVLDAHNS